MKLSIGTHYTVKAIRTLPAGVVVELDDKSTELVHISNISEKFVRDPANFVDVGEIYDAEAIKGNARPVELSFKHLNLSPRRNAQRSEQHSPKFEQHAPRAFSASLDADYEYYDETPKQTRRKKSDRKKRNIDDYDY